MTLLKTFDKEDIRYLGIRPDKLYVFSCNLLKEFPYLQIDFCDHFDIEEQLQREKILTDRMIFDTTRDRLYVYFSTFNAAISFINELNGFLQQKLEDK